MSSSEPQEGKSPSQLIDARIEELDDWRGELLARLRALVKEADPEVVEEWKWRGVPVWSHDGIVCTGETYKSVVKMTFAKGAALDDPSDLFNSSLEGNTRRAIDFREHEEIDEEALKALVRAAVSLTPRPPSGSLCHRARYRESARSSAARSYGPPCVASTCSTGRSSNGRRPSTTCPRVTSESSQRELISSPPPKSTSVSPATTARWLSIQSTRSFGFSPGSASTPTSSRSPAAYGCASPIPSFSSQ